MIIVQSMAKRLHRYHISQNIAYLVFIYIFIQMYVLLVTKCNAEVPQLAYINLRYATGSVIVIMDGMKIQKHVVSLPFY